MKKSFLIFSLILPMLLFSASMNKNGIVTKCSEKTVADIVTSLVNISKEHDMGELTIIDHKQNAKKYNSFDIDNAKLIIFPGSNTCLNLLKYDPAVGLDLPIKILIYVAPDKKVYVKYRDPIFLKNIYNIGNAKEAVKMSEILDQITSLAIK